jgi:hypothetical protein
VVLVVVEVLVDVVVLVEVEAGVLVLVAVSVLVVSTSVVSTGAALFLESRNKATKATSRTATKASTVYIIFFEFGLGSSVTSGVASTATGWLGVGIPSFGVSMWVYFYKLDQS